MIPVLAPSGRGFEFTQPSLHLLAVYCVPKPAEYQKNAFSEPYNPFTVDVSYRSNTLRDEMNVE